MKNNRFLLVLAFVVFVAVVTVACIKFLNVPREEHLATIELPSGDRIIVRFCYLGLESAFFKQGGRLKYDIYSGESHSSGELGVTYDMLQDVRLTHEIQGERRVKIEEARRRSIWIFEGDLSGKYEIIDLYKQKHGIK